MKRVAILISGGGSNMVELVKSMTGDHPARPVLVLSNVVEAGGLAKAAALGVECATVSHKDFPNDRNGFEGKLQVKLEEHNVDLICLAGFMRVLTPRFSARWQGRALNIHPSLLPLHKGLHTHARALEAGDKNHGCSVHEVTGELDGGRVLGQATLPIQPDDTPQTLAAKVLPFEHQLYAQVLKRYAAGDKTPLFLS